MAGMGGMLDFKVQSSANSSCSDFEGAGVVASHLRLKIVRRVRARFFFELSGWKLFEAAPFFPQFVFGEKQQAAERS